MPRNPTLKRALVSRHIQFIALGGIIGSSYFLGTGYLLNEIGPAILVAFIIGGLISYLTVSCLAELILNRPKLSFFQAAGRYISPSWACSVGWSYLFNWIIYIPSECIAAGILFNHFFPSVSVTFASFIFCLIITYICLSQVNLFGEAEFWFSLIKMLLMLVFSLFALAIFSGMTSAQPSCIKTEYLLNNGGFFAGGLSIFFSNMILLLSNYQGSEIIGLTAAEAKKPEKELPASLNKMALRILGFYLIPTTLLVLIFPWQNSSLFGSVFASALEMYGFSMLGSIFNFLIIVGALSCANSGLYAAIRSLHSLSSQKLASSLFLKVNSQGIPKNAALFVIIGIWVVLLTSFLFPSHHTYALLLTTSSFTGTICWISICLSAYIARKYDPAPRGKWVYKSPLFPVVPLLSIFLQVGSLFLLPFNNSLKPAFYLGVPLILFPYLLHKLYKN